MGSAIICFAMLFVFFMRDVHLLGAVPRRRLAPTLGAYGAVNTLCLVGLAAVLASDGASDPIRLVHTTPFWAVCILWHALIWLFCVILTRIGRPDLGWIAALFPAPVLVVALAGVALFIQHTIYGPAAAPILAMFLAGCWWAIISAAVLGHRWRPDLFWDSRSALDFAGMTNATALVLVPFSGLIQGL